MNDQECAMMLGPGLYTQPFQPPWHLKNALVQTLLASLKLRAWGKKKNHAAPRKGNCSLSG